MGNEVFNSSHPYQYGIFQDEPAKPGETKILRRPDTSGKELVTKNFIDAHTQLECVEYHMKHQPNNGFLGTRKYFPKENKYGEYIWKSWTEVYNISQLFLYGITKYKLCPHISVNDETLGGETKMRFMGIYSKNREEWIISSLGCQMDSITIITLYDTLGINSLEYILNETELITIVTETKNFEKIISIKESNKLGKVKNIIYLSCNEEDPKLEENLEKLKNLGLDLISYETIINTGRKCVEEKDEEILNRKYEKSKPESVFLICYTSGTVDNPKGAMVTQNSLVTATNVMYTIGYHVKSTDRIYSFLPLAHIMEQLIFSVCLVFGSGTGFSSGSLNRLLEDLQHLKPTYFCAVPRVYEKIYAQIYENINKRGALVRKLFDAAVNIKVNNYLKYGKLTHVFYDFIFFNKIRNMLGGELEWILSGGAPLQRDILQKLKVMIGCNFVQGYGQTENAGSALLNSIYDTTCGTTGGVQNTTELKLVDLPEYNYYSTDVNPVTGVYEPRGEICFRGCTVFKGYFKNKVETDKILDKDGWLHSGDVGVILTGDGNSIKIIDRVKSLFKLSQGEYVAPDKVQTILANSKYINQIFLTGDSHYSYAVALIYPELKECINFLAKKDNNDPEEANNKLRIEDICENQELINEIIKDCDTIGRKADLKGFELPKKILILKEPFTLENNLMTPTLKLKGKEIKIKYGEEIKKMYV